MMPRLVLLSAILLGGCTLGPDYVRPELPKADVFSEAGKGGSAIRAEWDWHVRSRLASIEYNNRANFMCASNYRL